MERWDADRFRDRWNSTFRIQLNQAVTSLSDQSRLLVDQAAQQEQTSNDDGLAAPIVPVLQTSVIADGADAVADGAKDAWNWAFG